MSVEFKNIITIDPEKRNNKVLIVEIDGVRSDVISQKIVLFYILFKQFKLIFKS